MSRVKRDQYKGNGINNAFNGFVNHSLTAPQREQFSNWLQDADIWNMFERAVDSGYRITVVKDKNNQAFQGSMKCELPSHNDYGWILTARAPDAASALALVLFKHFVLLGSDWTMFHEHDGEQGLWA